MNFSIVTIRRACLFTLLCGCIAAGNGNAALLQFTMDTSSLSGTPAIATFDLVDLDFAVDNNARIENFSAPGATLGSANAPNGGVTGALPATTTLTEDPSFGAISLVQPLTLGSSVSFRVRISENNSGTGVGPDSFVFALWDDTFTTLLFPTGDPSGLANFVIEIGGPGQVTSSSFDSDLISVRVIPEGQAPVPGTVLLIALGASALALLRRRRPMLIPAVRRHDRS